MKYRDSLIIFEKSTTVDVYLCAISARPGGKLRRAFIRMTMKLNKPPSACTLYEVRELKESNEEEASLEAKTMYIETPGEGSIQSCTALQIADSSPEQTAVDSSQELPQLAELSQEPPQSADQPVQIADSSQEQTYAAKEVDDVVRRFHRQMMEQTPYENREERVTGKKVSKGDYKQYQDIVALRKALWKAGKGES